MRCAWVQRERAARKSDLIAKTRRGENAKMSEVEAPGIFAGIMRKGVAFITVGERTLWTVSGFPERANDVSALD